MNKHEFAKWCAVSVFAMFATATQASSISLSPVSQNVALGGQVSLDLNMDFSGDPTVGGGVDILFDQTMLNFVSFTFNPSLGDDPYFRRSPDVLTGELNGIGFGSLFGLTGPSLVGTLVFDAIGTGTAGLNLADSDSITGGFYSYTNAGVAQAVTYTGATVNVTAVPVPAALWLLVSGMGLIGTVSRKKRR